MQKKVFVALKQLQDFGKSVTENPNKEMFDRRAAVWAKASESTDSTQRKKQLYKDGSPKFVMFTSTTLKSFCCSRVASVLL